MSGATLDVTETLTCVVHVRRDSFIAFVNGLFKAIEVSRQRGKIGARKLEESMRSVRELWRAWPRT